MTVPIYDQRDNDPRDNDPRVDAGNELSDALRWQLRALRRDEVPPRELWPGIAARLQATRSPSVSGRRRWTAPAAVAATLVIALGVAGLWRGALPPSGATRDTLVQREAAGMVRQYTAAIGEVAVAPTAPAMQATLDELDRNTSLILDALAHDPDSRLLLEQLRRTYAHRLALTQRAVYS